MKNPVGESETETKHSTLKAALAVICSHARRRVTEMAAERPVEIGKVAEAYFEGDVGDLSILTFVTGEEFFSLFKSLMQNVLRES